MKKASYQKTLLNRFVLDIAKAKPDWVMGNYIDEAVKRIREQVGKEEVLLGLGYRVRRNDPYAGGYVTRHYGRPRDAVHALQIEIARSLYMDEARIERSAGLLPLARDLTALMGHLARTDWSFLRT